MEYSPEFTRVLLGQDGASERLMEIIDMMEWEGSLFDMPGKIKRSDMDFFFGKDREEETFFDLTVAQALDLQVDLLGVTIPDEEDR